MRSRPQPLPVKRSCGSFADAGTSPTSQQRPPVADTAEQLRRLYAQRATIVTAGRVADEAAARGDRAAVHQGEKLFAELKRVDQAIDRLEAGSDTKH